MADLRGDSGDEFAPAPKLTGTGGETATVSAKDPFAVTPFVTPTRSSRTRTVTFIRNTKEQSMTVDAAPSAPSNWVGATTDDPSDEKSK